MVMERTVAETISSCQATVMALISGAVGAISMQLQASVHGVTLVDEGMKLGHGMHAVLCAVWQSRTKT